MMFVFCTDNNNIFICNLLILLWEFDGGWGEQGDLSGRKLGRKRQNTPSGLLT